MVKKGGGKIKKYACREYEKLNHIDNDKSYVYRYTDLADGIVKYVGIVNEGKLINRNRQHANEDWFKQSEYLFEYIEVPNRSTAEAIEAHLISLYGTDKWYNKAKANWGTIEYLPNEFDWQTVAYSINEIIKNLEFSLNFAEDKGNKKINIDIIREYIEAIKHYEKVENIKKIRKTLKRE